MSDSQLRTFSLHHYFKKKQTYMLQLLLSLISFSLCLVLADEIDTALGRTRLAACPWFIAKQADWWYLGYYQLFKEQTDISQLSECFEYIKIKILGYFNGHILSTFISLWCTWQFWFVKAFENLRCWLFIPAFVSTYLFLFAWPTQRKVTAPEYYCTFVLSGLK